MMTMMKYNIKRTKLFRKQYKLLEKRGYNIVLLDSVILMLAGGETLPAQYNDHPLKGNRKGFRDCHIQNDWILIYKIDNGVLTLFFSETGTRSDLLE